MKNDKHAAAVYAAEARVWGRTECQPDAGFDYLQRVALRVTSGAAWRAIAGPRARVRVAVNNSKRKRSGAAAYRDNDDFVVIAMARGSRNVPYLLHELAHAALPFGVFHGPSFCRALLALVAEFYGEAVSVRLHREFRRARILA